jgi:electron transport complex protein RnfD
VDQWSKQVVDGYSSATPLAMQKFDHITTGTFDLLVGSTAGSVGETSAILILLCGGYLALRNMLDWRIPASIFVGTIITSGIFYLANPERFPSPVFMLFAGGMMLGAIFMATDMVGSPVTPLGTWIYGLLIGFFTVVIRLFGGLPEGIMYAILLGNAIAPLIEWVTQPKIYGDPRKFKRKADDHQGGKP